MTNPEVLLLTSTILPNLISCEIDDKEEYVTVEYEHLETKTRCKIVVSNLSYMIAEEQYKIIEAYAKNLPPIKPLTIEEWRKELKEISR